MLSVGSAGMTSDAVGSADGGAGSTGAVGVEGDMDLDGAAIGFIGDAAATSSSVPQASWEG